MTVLVVLLPAWPVWGQQAAKTSPPAAPAKAAADDQTQAPKDWQVMLRLHQETLVQQADRVKSMESLLLKNVRHFRSELSVLQGKLDELRLIISLSGGNPRELRAVLSDIQQLQQNVDELVAPLQEARDELQKISVQLDSLKDEFSKRLDDDPEADIATAIQYYIRYLGGVKAGLSGDRSGLDKQLAPAKELQQSLTETRDFLRKKIPEAWRAYYLTSSPELFSWKSWSNSWQRMQLWSKTYFTMMLSLVTGADAQQSLSVVMKIAVGLLFLIGLDFVAWRRLCRRAPQLRAKPALRRVWLMAGVGILLHWVALDAPLILNESCNGVAEILLAAALSKLSWFLVQVSGLVEDGKAVNPLRWLWRLYAVGVALQILDIPDPLMSACWVVFLGLFFRLERQRVGREVGPLRWLVRGTPALLLGLIVMTALGWQHLAVLLLAGWFLVLAAVQLGAGLSRVVSHWQSRAETEGLPLLTRTLVSGLGMPVITMSLFLLVAFWFSIELGGQDFFVEAVTFAIPLGSASVSVGRLALILTGFFLTRAVIFVARSLLEDLPKLRPEIDAGVWDVLDTTSLYFIWGCYALISLFLLGFSLTSLAVVAGGLSVGIGFGLQNIVNNFIAGLILLFGRSIQTGDVIQIDTLLGQVRKVNIRNTIIQTVDNATLFMPNSDLIAGKLINWSHRDPTVRRDISVGVAYGSNVEQVRAILQQTAEEHKRVLRNPPPFVLFKDFGESSLDFTLYFWIDNVSASLTTMSDIRFVLDRKFREAKIDIPFPQREVRVVGEACPSATEAAAAAGAD